MKAGANIRLSRESYHTYKHEHKKRSDREKTSYEQQSDLSLGGPGFSGLRKKSHKLNAKDPV
jgi:hypothetical protein